VIRSGRELRVAQFVASGAFSGAFSALVFCVVHQLLISPIWFALIAMLVAGAVSGASLAWSYALVARRPTVGSWIRYNSLYVVILLALGAVSLIMFEPITSIATLLESNEPPRALIGRALPITLFFTIGSGGLLTLLYRPGRLGALAIFVTTLVVILFLGLNISILGLVFVPKSSLYVIGEVVALIVALALVYAVSMAYVWRIALQSHDRAV
jgi:hypothetical protein